MHIGLTQQEQRAKWREDWRKRHPVKPARIFMHPTMGRLVEHEGYATRIFWNQQMLHFLKNNYATTTNDELAGCLGVSTRTMIRKARQLGLQKDKEWLAQTWNDNRMMAHAVSKRMGYPGTFRKGEHASPATEFKKGHLPFNKKYINPLNK